MPPAPCPFELCVAGATPRRVAVRCDVRAACTAWHQSRGAARNPERVVVSFYATALSLFLEDRSGVLQPTFGTPCTAVYKLVIRLAVASGAWALARPECGSRRQYWVPAGARVSPICKRGALIHPLTFRRFGLLRPRQSCLACCTRVTRPPPTPRSIHVSMAPLSAQSVAVTPA